jgi:hypothetical protein
MMVKRVTKREKKERMVETRLSLWNLRGCRQGH